MARGDLVPTGGLDPESLTQDREDRLRLHRADTGQTEESLLQIASIARIAPDLRRIVAVVPGDRGAERLDLAGHGAGESMDRRTLSEGVREAIGIDRRERRRVEGAESTTDLERPVERLLDRHLLVEREPDQECERLLHEKAIRLL